MHGNINETITHDGETYTLASLVKPREGDKIAVLRYYGEEYAAVTIGRVWRDGGTLLVGAADVVSPWANQYVRIIERATLPDGVYRVSGGAIPWFVKGGKRCLNLRFDGEPFHPVPLPADTSGWTRIADLPTWGQS